jgi:hypothetical protein
MNAIRESVPALWSETDERFFRVVAEVFPTSFLWGAGTLLASYDAEHAAGTDRYGFAASAASAATGAPLGGTSACRA